MSFYFSHRAWAPTYFFISLLACDASFYVVVDNSLKPLDIEIMKRLQSIVSHLKIKFSDSVFLLSPPLSPSTPLPHMHAPMKLSYLSLEH